MTFGRAQHCDEHSSLQIMLSIINTNIQHTSVMPSVSWIANSFGVIVMSTVWYVDVDVGNVDVGVDVVLVDGDDNGVVVDFVVVVIVVIVVDPPIPILFVDFNCTHVHTLVLIEFSKFLFGFCFYLKA